MEIRQWQPTGPIPPNAAKTESRVLLAHAAVMSDALVAASPCLTPGPAEVAALTAMVLDSNLAGATALMEALHRDGAAPETLYLDLLAPAARRLGVFWQDDTCDFTQVTLGVVHLQHLMRALGPAFHADAARWDRDVVKEGRQILLCPLPGQQHSFGLSMVAEFFRRAGWSVSLGLDVACPDVATMVRQDWFSIVGFSASCDDELAPLTAAIRAVRRASRNPRVGILVGGPLFIENPAYTAVVGADATSVDARAATLQAERLLTLLAPHD